jgi:hypothetical protein
MFARVSNSSETDVGVGFIWGLSKIFDPGKQCDELAFANLFLVILLVTSVKS